MKPIRIQRKRSKGWKMPSNTIYVGRPNIFGNPFKVGINIKRSFTSRGVVDVKFEIDNIGICLEYYKNWLEANSYDVIARERLKGKNVACWCPLDKPCHADILLKIANE